MWSLADLGVCGLLWFLEPSAYPYSFRYVLLAIDTRHATETTASLTEQNKIVASLQSLQKYLVEVSLGACPS